MVMSCIWFFFELTSLPGIAREWSREQFAFLTLEARSHGGGALIPGWPNTPFLPSWVATQNTGFSIHPKELAICYKRSIS